MLGFSKDFEDGNCVKMKSYALCGRAYIPPPEECLDVNTCLCLCKKLSDIGDYCSEEGRICYGYDQFEFIGGAKRDCLFECIPLFCDQDGETGEDNRPIKTWKGKEIDDPDEIFNSLAIVNSDISQSIISMNIERGVMSFEADGNTVSVNGMIIRK